MPPEALSRPEWPRPAASAIIFRGESVLIVERGKGTAPGIWSLPGGHIEPGEKARDAAVRELLEETGLAVELMGLVDVHDGIFRDGEGVLRAHYVLAVYWGRSETGEPVAATDVRDARFVPVSAISGYTMTPGAHAIIRRAYARHREMP